MSLGAGAWKKEGPVAQKGSLALELTMATKRAPATQHRHTANPAAITISEW